MLYGCSEINIGVTAHLTNLPTKIRTAATRTRAEATGTETGTRKSLNTAMAQRIETINTKAAMTSINGPITKVPRVVPKIKITNGTVQRIETRARTNIGATRTDIVRSIRVATVQNMVTNILGV